MWIGCPTAGVQGGGGRNHRLRPQQGVRRDGRIPGVWENPGRGKAGPGTGARKALFGLAYPRH